MLTLCESEFNLLNLKRVMTRYNKIAFAKLCFIKSVQNE